MTVHAGGDHDPVKPSRGLQRWLPRISVIDRSFDSRELAVHQIVEVGKLHIENPNSKPKKGNPRKQKQAQKGNTRSNFSGITRLLKWWQLLKSRTKKKVKRTKIDIFARAFYRMQLLTNSQMEMLLETCGLVKEGDDNKEMEIMVERVMAWRDMRGDFENVDGYEEEDAELQQDPIILPFDMEDISEKFLHFCGLLETDLQLECLLRNIQYSRDDTKLDLVSKLMQFKHKLFSESRELGIGK